MSEGEGTDSSDSNSGATSESGDASDSEGDGVGDVGNSEDVEVVWAKSARGIGGLGHVFEGQLSFTRDIMDSSMLKD